MTRLTAMIVDDEAPARELLTLMLGQDPLLEVIGSFPSCTALLSALEKQSPDLLLLDIGLPGEDGVELARRCIAMKPDIAIVFVTAFDDRAIEAFEINALDYLLKPVDDARLRESIERARQALNRTQLAERIGWAAEAIQGRANRDALIVRSVRRVDVVAICDVHCLLSAGNYVEVRLDGKTLLHRVTIERLARELDPRCFMRVHRSAIVNLHFVRQVLTRSKGRRTLVMANGDRVPVSNSYLNDVVAALEQ